METLSDTIIKNAVEWTLIPGFGIRTRNRILGKVRRIPDLFYLKGTSLRSLALPDRALDSIRSRSCRPAAEEIFDWAAREKCRILVFGYGEYPSLLNQIHNAPLVLYALGSLEHLDRPCISIVGSRRPSLYGLQMSRGIASDLCRAGICVVSGLARGIDAAAHRGCLEGNGSTVSVLGCGIDTVYPPEHRQLKEQIARRGLVLSEFPPGTVPSPHNFPVRNRIISGLSLGSLVVEAGEKSGSLITARLALEQNRDVYAIPGNLTSPSSFGTNFLIKQGAKLIQSWKDIVEEMPFRIRESILTADETNTDSAGTGIALDASEKKILHILKLDEATHIDEVFCRGELPVPDLSEQLLNLELKGLIRRLPGDMYILSGKIPDK